MRGFKILIVFVFESCFGFLISFGVDGLIIKVGSGKSECYGYKFLGGLGVCLYYIIVLLFYSCYKFVKV